LVALVVAIRVAWRVLLCAFGTLIKLLMWLLIPRWLLGNRFASAEEHVGQPTDEGSLGDEGDWSVCGVTCGASGDKDEAFTDDEACAVVALVSTNQTTPQQQAQAEHGASEHHTSGSTVLPQLQRLDESVSTETETTHRPLLSSLNPNSSAMSGLLRSTRQLEQQSSTSRILHKTSNSGQERLQQIEIEVQSRFMYESSSHSLASSPFKTTDKAWRQDAAASSPAVEARPEDLMISSPNGMQVMSPNAMQHGVEGAGMNLQVNVTVTRAHLPVWQR
jgi:hypothetical protein